ncbi:hypothetical protein [Bradyrhizobium sp. Gha]|uniref:hypothetical protein n=1 Tax=Bradyrhizobium sp. Gha TaxID=1855318 RepID=UPI000B85EE39|nr:hypothetical protein [Bradyrhizobium sp. Gha]
MNHSYAGPNCATDDATSWQGLPRPGAAAQDTALQAKHWQDAEEFSVITDRTEQDKFAGPNLIERLRLKLLQGGRANSGCRPEI